MSSRPDRPSGVQVSLLTSAALATQMSNVAQTTVLGLLVYRRTGSELDLGFLGGVHEAMEDLRFVRRDSILLGAISLDLFAVLLGGAITLLPAIAVRLHVGAVGLGWLRAAAGLGAGGMALLISFRPVRRRVGYTLFGVVILFGIWTVVLGLTRSYSLAFIAIFALSAADAVSMFIRSTLVPLVAPPAMRGRVLA